MVKIMRIKVCCDLQEKESLYIKINNEIKTFDSFDNVAEFDVFDCFDLGIEIERKPDKSNRRIIDIIFFVITIFIQGIFNCIFINDNFRWYEDIIPFGFTAKINLSVKDNLIIKILYNKANYNGTVFNLPKLLINGEKVEDIKYIANPTSVANCWFNYVKRMISIASVLMLIMGLLMAVSISNNNLIATIIVGMISVGTVVLASVISCVQHKKLKKFYTMMYKR